MKNENEKENAKSKKGRDSDLLKVKKNSSDESRDSQDEIREKANEIYLQRIERGEDGTAELDWIEAEKLLNESEN
jgi:hypothetical protein